MTDFTNEKELAQLLDGRQYRHEITKEEEQKAKELGLIIASGASDDLVEFEGSMREEYGAWDGQKWAWNGNGDFVPAEDVDNPRSIIDQIWDPEDKDYSWWMETNIPGAEYFTIKEGEDNYCRGIVFKRSNLESPIGSENYFKETISKLIKALEKTMSPEYVESDDGDVHLQATTEKWLENEQECKQLLERIKTEMQDLKE